MNRDQRADRAVLVRQVAFVVAIALGFVALLWATSATVYDEQIRVTAARGSR